MRETLILSIPALFGVVLGVVFFGGLWWTVRTALRSVRPELWLLCSLMLRTAVVLAGFYAVAPGGPGPMLICLLGFVAAKFAMTLLAKPPLARGVADASKS